MESCHRACLSPKLEAGCCLGHEGHRTCPADILVLYWELGHPGALDLTITSPLNSTVLSEVSVRGRISCTGSLKAQAPSKSQMLNSLYGRLNLTLIRCNARAILSRSHFASCEQVVLDDVFV